jgi:ribosomal protein S18 acetylase RimI-like enzyme
MDFKDREEIAIRKLAHTDEAKICARMMADSEPWITLGRDYETVLRIISHPTREVYLAVDGNKEIAGFIMLNMQGAFVGYIQCICIGPDWRNQGIGSRLIAFAEQLIFHETPNVFICVSSFNPGAKRLYERLGYEVIGELKNYIVAGHSEILLRKTIAPLTEFKRKQQASTIEETG